MKIIFEHLKIHNFMSFKDQEFDFSNDVGFTLVTGENKDIQDSKNGSGKSSLFSALLYALFGQLQYNIKNANLRNRYVKDKTMFVEVVFSTGNGERYFVKRMLNKYNQTSLSLERETKEGEREDLTRFSIMETDAFIQKEILRCDISIFLRVIFLSSDQNYNFFKLTPAAKRDFIEKLFDISVFGEMYSMMHKDLLKLDKEIASKQSGLVILNKNKENYETKAKAYESEKKLKFKDLEKRITKLQAKRDKEASFIESPENIEKLEKIETAMNTLSDTISEQEKLLRKVEKSKIIAENYKLKYETVLKNNEELIAKHSDLLKSICDKCRGIVEQYYKITEYRKEISSAKKGLDKISEKENEINMKMKEISSKISEISSKRTKLERAREQLMSKKLKHDEELRNIERELVSVIKLYEDMKEKLNPYLELVKEATEEISENNNQLAEMTEKFNYLKFAENIVNADTLKKFIIKDLVQLLNDKIQRYLAKLGAEFECVFDENMDCRFITAGGGECDYANFSSGEQMRIMISTCFAFKDFMETRNSFSSNILILDEFIDSGIDDLAINGVLGILEGFKVIGKQNIYIISHRISVADNYSFDNIITVVKEKNISRVELSKQE